MPHPPATHSQVLELLKRHGWNTTSFQCLEPGLRHWFAPDGDGCVAYADTGRAWVAAGAPVASTERLAEVAAQFITSAHATGRRACFFATERRFNETVPYARLRIGEQPVWNPQEWETTLRNTRSLREQLRRSRAKGLQVRAVTPEELAAPESPVRSAVSRLLEQWLASRTLPPMGFLDHVHLDTFLSERRCFVAEQEGQAVGFLAMVPIYARQGWLLEDLLRDPSAPNGTSEALFDAAIRTAAAEGSTHLTFGLAPLSGNVRGWLRWIRKWSAEFYNFEGLRAFKARLRPERWEPVYLSYADGTNGFIALCDAMTAFTNGQPLHFGREALRRSSAPAPRALAGLLLPSILCCLLSGLPRVTE